MNNRAHTTRLLQHSSRTLRAFTLIETITVLTIAVMIMTATLTIYGRVKAAAASINQTLDKNILATEILQRIAEDLDRLAAPGLDTKITVINKPDSSGYDLSRMVIENKIYDKDNKPQIFEKVVWQNTYHYLEDARILYRSHGGIALEDRVITDTSQAERQKLGNELFIPLCSGITFFSIRIPRGETFQNQWTANSLPKAVTVTVSFALPVETIDGEFELLDEEKISRTIAVDRTRKIKYNFIKKEFSREDLEKTEPNEIDADQMVDETDTDITDADEIDAEQISDDESDDAELQNKPDPKVRNRR